jgi:hypothetical protein
MAYEMPSMKKAVDYIYHPYCPLVTNNRFPCTDEWQRPDRKDCPSLYYGDGVLYTPDEYWARYDDQGRRKIDRLWVQACEDDPTGQKCGRCDQPNFWCDDCGWFSIRLDENCPESYVPVCKACWDACGGSTAER